MEKIMNINMFPQNYMPNKLKKEYIEDFEKFIQSGELRWQEPIKKFENLMATSHGFSSAIGVSSGTDALTIALQSLDLPKNSEVITTPFTYLATVSSIIKNDLKPVFADINLDTLQVSTTEINNVITNNTAALLPVHINGNYCDISDIRNKAKNKDIAIVEDSAQLITCKEAIYDSSSSAICFSLGPTKNVMGLLEAGCILTNDHNIEDKSRIIARNGNKGGFLYPEIGLNGKIDALATHFLLRNFQYLNYWNIRRKEIAERYDNNLKNLAEIKLIKRNEIESNCKYSLYVFSERNQLRRYLEECGIEVDIYYPTPLHIQDSLKYLGYMEGDMPNAEKAGKHVISLPINQFLNNDQIDFISERIINFYEK